MNKISVYRKYTSTRDTLKEKNAFGGDNIGRFYTHNRVHHTCGFGFMPRFPSFPSDYKINNRKHSNKLNRMEIKENGTGKRLRRVRQLRELRFVYRMYPTAIGSRKTTALAHSLIIYYYLFRYHMAVIFHDYHAQILSSISFRLGCIYTYKSTYV